MICGSRNLSDYYQCWKQLCCFILLWKHQKRWMVYSTNSPASSVCRRAWRTCREKSRDTELMPSACRTLNASNGNSNNIRSARITTDSPGSGEHTYRRSALFILKRTHYALFKVLMLFLGSTRTGWDAWMFIIFLIFSIVAAPLFPVCQ